MLEQLKKSIDRADKILVTSHVSPDPDSISSMLLLGTTLRVNYPNKIIVTSIEEPLDELSFLTGYDRVQKAPLLEIVTGADLIILVDAMNFERASRKDAQKVKAAVKEKNIPLIIIDHHEPVGVEENEIYINEDYPSAVQQVYKTLFDDLKLQKPEGYAQTTMVGMYSDTGGFVYIERKPQETLKLAGELIEAGVNIQSVKTKLSQYTSAQIEVLKQLLGNLLYDDDYTYSFLPDDFMEDFIRNKQPVSDLNGGISMFTGQYLRNIDGRKWGFVVYRNPLLDDHMYSVSMRAVNGVVDVAQIAGLLDGGGHKAAAGAKVQGHNVNEAIEKVQQAIKQVRGS